MGNLNGIDLAIVAAYLVITMGIGLAFTRRGGKDMGSFFLSGRNLPWWVAGLSLVATSFASDTPLWVTSLVRNHGLRAVWQFWAMSIGLALSSVLFSRWWRRLGITTEVEFLELRYSGRSAAVLRGWGASFYAFVLCPIMVAWVTKAMSAIVRESLGLEIQEEAIVVGLILLFSALVCVSSGLDGVVYTGLIIFFFCILSGIVTALFALKATGGMSGLMAGLEEHSVWPVDGMRILPRIGSGQGEMSLWNAVGYFGLLWIGTAYSGAYIAQRMMACRNSKHATLAQLTNTVVYCGILPWPWILVALCSIVLIGNVGTPSADDGAYVAVAMKVLPAGLKGVFIASMLAAFMSTISALFNWGSSCVVNDIYKRFVIRNASPRHYVWTGRITTVLLAVVGGGASIWAEDIQQLLEIAFVVGGSLHLITVLRWFWPRLTAWGELAGLTVSAVVSPLLLTGVLDPFCGWLFRLPGEVAFHSEYSMLGARIFFMLSITTLTAVLVSLLAPAVPPETLALFAQRGHPFQALWKKTVPSAPLSFETIPATLLSWGLILAMMISLLDGIRNLLFGQCGAGAGELLLSGLFLLWILRRVFSDYDRECEMERNEKEPD